MINYQDLDQINMYSQQMVFAWNYIQNEILMFTLNKEWFFSGL